MSRGVERLALCVRFFLPSAGRRPSLPAAVQLAADAGTLAGRCRTVQGGAPWRGTVASLRWQQQTRRRWSSRWCRGRCARSRLSVLRATGTAGRSGPAHIAAGCSLLLQLGLREARCGALLRRADAADGVPGARGVGPSRSESPLRAGRANMSV